jgi:hypothetical protein
MIRMMIPTIVMCSPFGLSSLTARSLPAGNPALFGSERPPHAPRGAAALSHEPAPSASPRLAPSRGLSRCPPQWNDGPQRTVPVPESRLLSCGIGPSSVSRGDSLCNYPRSRLQKPSAYMARRVKHVQARSASPRLAPSPDRRPGRPWRLRRAERRPGRSPCAGSPAPASAAPPRQGGDLRLEPERGPARARSRRLMLGISRAARSAASASTRSAAFWKAEMASPGRTNVCSHRGQVADRTGADTA